MNVIILRLVFRSYNKTDKDPWKEDLRPFWKA